jgi:hypothetical protein
LEIVINDGSLSSYSIDLATIRYHIRLWKKLHCPDVIKPLPPCERFLPAQHSTWNKAKPGSDTLTFLLSKHQLRVPKSIKSPEATVIGRMLMMSAIACHRLFQLTSATKPVSDYESIIRYRNASSHRFTFRRTLLELERALSSATDVVIDDGETSPRKRVLRNTIPDHDNWAREKSWKTPRCKVVKGDVQQKRIELYENSLSSCDGTVLAMMIDADGDDRRLRCRHCSEKTKFYCLGCDRAVCFDQFRDESILGEKEKFKVSRRNPSGTGEQVHFFRMSCYHVLHKETFNAK